MNDLDLHPEPEQLESYLEGTLEEGQRAVLESHLVGCSRCQTELEEWRALFGALESLPSLEPSAGFADRVMARVTVRPTAAQAAATSRWLPRTSRGWSLVAAFLALPVLGLGALAAWLVTQPWATLASAEAVVAFAWTRASAAISGVVAQVTALLLQSSAAQSIAALFRQFVAVAGTRGVGLAAAALSLGLLGSAWILYHNLVRNSTREEQYAPYTI